MNENQTKETNNTAPDQNPKTENQIILSPEDQKRLITFATGPADGILDEDLTEKLRLIYLAGQKTDLYSPEDGILRIDTGMRKRLYPIRVELGLARVFGKLDKTDKGGQ